jgi:hypothetical protein
VTRRRRSKHPSLSRNWPACLPPPSFPDIYGSNPQSEDTGIKQRVGQQSAIDGVSAWIGLECISDAMTAAALLGLKHAGSLGFRHPRTGSVDASLLGIVGVLHANSWRS